MEETLKKLSISELKTLAGLLYLPKTCANKGVIILRILTVPDKPGYISWEFAQAIWCATNNGKKKHAKNLLELIGFIAKKLKGFTGKVREANQSPEVWLEHITKVVNWFLMRKSLNEPHSLFYLEYLRFQEFMETVRKQCNHYRKRYNRPTTVHFLENVVSYLAVLDMKSTYIIGMSNDSQAMSTEMSQLSNELDGFRAELRSGIEQMKQNMQGNNEVHEYSVQSSVGMKIVLRRQKDDCRPANVGSSHEGGTVGKPEKRQKVDNRTLNGESSPGRNLRKRPAHEYQEESEEEGGTVGKPEKRQKVDNRTLNGESSPGRNLRKRPAHEYQEESEEEGGTVGKPEKRQKVDNRALNGESSSGRNLRKRPAHEYQEESEEEGGTVEIIALPEASIRRIEKFESLFNTRILDSYDFTFTGDEVAIRCVRKGCAKENSVITTVFEENKHIKKYMPIHEVVCHMDIDECIWCHCSVTSLMCSHLKKECSRNCLVAISKKMQFIVNEKYPVFKNNNQLFVIPNNPFFDDLKGRGL